MKIIDYKTKHLAEYIAQQAYSFVSKPLQIEGERKPIEVEKEIFRETHIIQALLDPTVENIIFSLDTAAQDTKATLSFEEFKARSSALQSFGKLGQMLFSEIVKLIGFLPSLQNNSAMLSFIIGSAEAYMQFGEHSSAGEFSQVGAIATSDVDFSHEYINQDTIISFFYSNLMLALSIYAQDCDFYLSKKTAQTPIDPENFSEMSKEYFSSITFAKQAKPVFDDTSVSKYQVDQDGALTSVPYTNENYFEGGESYGFYFQASELSGVSKSLPYQAHLPKGVNISFDDNIPTLIQNFQSAQRTADEIEDIRKFIFFLWNMGRISQEGAAALFLSSVIESGINSQIEFDRESSKKIIDVLQPVKKQLASDIANFQAFQKIPTDYHQDVIGIINDCITFGAGKAYQREGSSAYKEHECESLNIYIHNVIVIDFETMVRRINALDEKIISLSLSDFGSIRGLKVSFSHIDNHDPNDSLFVDTQHLTQDGNRDVFNHQMAVTISEITDPNFPSLGFSSKTLLIDNVFEAIDTNEFQISDFGNEVLAYIPSFLSEELFRVIG